MFDKKMITHIGSIKLTSPMWWENNASSNAFIDEVVETIDGGFIVYRIPKKDILFNIVSGDTQIQTSLIVEELINLSKINAPTTIADYDGVIYNVEFVHTDNGAVNFNTVFDARLADLWLGTIKVRTI